MSSIDPGFGGGNHQQRDPADRPSNRRGSGGDDRSRAGRGRDERNRDERSRDDRSRDQRSRNDRSRDERNRNERSRDGRGRTGTDRSDRAQNERGRVQHSRIDRPSGRGGQAPLFLLAFIVVAAVAAGGWYLFSGTPTITVEMTDTPESVAQRLNELDDKYVPAEVADILEGPGPAPVAGTYEIDTSLDLPTTVRALQIEWIEADPGITFPEGFTVRKIANRIAANRWAFTANQLIVTADGLTVDPRVQRPAGITSVEGLLYPNTYPVDASGDSSATMGQMLVAMQNLLFDELDAQAGSQALGLSPYQVITIASLIEKEAKTEQDRPLIARVILNRLELDMELAIDASLFYEAPEDATWSELKERDTPYNLYLHKGLPPTPIANPGRASLEAALNPAPPLDPSDPRCEGIEESDCKLLFYVVADADGNHEFAVTYEQHQANIEVARAAGVL